MWLLRSDNRKYVCPRRLESRPLYFKVLMVRSLGALAFVRSLVSSFFHSFIWPFLRSFVCSLIRSFCLLSVSIKKGPELNQSSVNNQLLKRKQVTKRFSKTFSVFPISRFYAENGVFYQFWRRKMTQLQILLIFAETKKETSINVILFGAFFAVLTK